MISPTQRTLKKWRKYGYVCAVTEKWNPWAKVRQDLFGFIDVLALSPPVKSIYSLIGRNIIAIQCTSRSNHSKRKAKILAEKRAYNWLCCGGKIYISSWSKKGARGKRKLWEEYLEKIELDMFGIGGEQR